MESCSPATKMPVIVLCCSDWQSLVTSVMMPCVVCSVPLHPPATKKAGGSNPRPSLCHWARHFTGLPCVKVSIKVVVHFRHSDPGGSCGATCRSVPPLCARTVVPEYSEWPRKAAHASARVCVSHGTQPQLLHSLPHKHATNSRTPVHPVGRLSP